jgi:alanine dehydrogenase
MLMNDIRRIGILRETKKPPERRVPLTPAQTVTFREHYPYSGLYVQPSKIRGFQDEEYRYLKVNLREDLSHCDLLLGIKEVDPATFIPGKTYMFFAHVGKKQPHNRKMLQEALEKKITLIDYEYLTDNSGNRIIAFGRWAGMVGAYNGLRALGLRNQWFELKPAHECLSMEEMFSGLKLINLPPVKILLTGGGRVARGAMETLRQVSIKEVAPEEFLGKEFTEPVLARLDPGYYVRHKKGRQFSFQHFVDHPDEYESAFKPYQKVTDLFVACHYWDPRSPHFITRTDLKEPDTKISVIADVSCDSNGPIASTLRASSIADPFYDYNPDTGQEEPPFYSGNNITVMAVDNLPGELPRESSHDFGQTLLERVFPFLLGEDKEGMIDRATITRNGKLTPRYNYLQDYVLGKE